MFGLAITSGILLRLDAQVVSVPPAFAPAGLAPPDRVLPPLAFAGPSLSKGERTALPLLDEAERARLEAPSRPGGPLTIGITRWLPSPIRFCAESAADPQPGSGRIETLNDGTTVWTAAVRSPGAAGIRLHLAIESLPESAQINFYSTKGERHGPYSRASIVDPSSFWGPTVSDEAVFVELRILPGTLVEMVLQIDSVAHMRTDAKPGHRLTAAPDGDACMVDFRCAAPPPEAYASIAETAVSSFDFVQSDGGVGSCTGSLLNDTDDSSWIPYFLTAAHCVSTSAEANSIESYWDYLRDSCGSETWSAIRLVGGASLMSTVSSSDSSLLRLAAVPPGDRAFLGWIADPNMAYSTGCHWYRLHYPATQDGSAILPLSYNEGYIDDLASCPGLSRGYFTFSRSTIGDVWHASSGSSMYVSLGRGPQIIGQLLGSCSSEDSCSGDARIDGSFYASYQVFKFWLDPNRPPLVTGLNPSSGPVGTIVSITGSHLAETQAVSFSGTLALFTIVSNSEVRATVPVGATSGYVGLQTPYGSTSAPTGFTVIEPSFVVVFGAAGDVPLAGAFDADGQSEFGVFRPARGWYYVDFGRNGWQAGTDLAAPFGLAGDVPFVGDFDGDGLSDFGVFRPSTGWYYVDLGRNGGQAGRYIAAPFGRAGDIPFVGDFDADGKNEFGVFRPSKGTYYVDLGRNGWHAGEDLAVGFGVSGDIPFVGDFDGDGLSDFGVSRPSTGWYFIDLGRNGGLSDRYIAAPFGKAGDVPFVGDFDGDGHDEPGVFRPSNGFHYVDLGRDGWHAGQDIARGFGEAGDIPFVGRFDLDLRSDFGVFRPREGRYYVDLGN